MTVDLTSAEFRQLLDMVYIGNWVLNSARGDDRITEYDRIESKIFGLCSGTPLSALVEKRLGISFPSRAFEDGGIHEAIAYYEDAVFFDILAEELARRDRLGSAVRTGLDFEPRPSYLIPTAETTRECPDPFPAPTETESQCRKEAPLATNSLKIAQNHELSASAHTFAPFLCTLFVNFVRIFLLLTLITQDLMRFPNGSLTERRRVAYNSRFDACLNAMQVCGTARLLLRWRRSRAG